MQRFTKLFKEILEREAAGGRNGSLTIKSLHLNFFFLLNSMGISNRNKKASRPLPKESSNIFYLLNMNGNSGRSRRRSYNQISLAAEPQHKRNMKWAEFCAPFRVDESRQSDEVCL